jgi:hypothetical protein
MLIRHRYQHLQHLSSRLRHSSAHLKLHSAMHLKLSQVFLLNHEADENHIEFISNRFQAINTDFVYCCYLSSAFF